MRITKVWQLIAYPLSGFWSFLCFVLRSPYPGKIYPSMNHLHDVPISSKDRLDGSH